MFISPNILICYKSTPLKLAQLETWLFLKLWGYGSSFRFHVVMFQTHYNRWSSSSSVCFVSQGRIKHIHENMPKNAIEPSPKFDGHLSKSANRVTSLLSYRAFELTQVSTCLPQALCYQSFFFPSCIHIYVPSSLLAIFFWVCIRWDQGPAQACMPLRCGFLSVQRQGSCSDSNDCTQVHIPAGNGTKSEWNKSQLFGVFF